MNVPKKLSITLTLPIDPPRPFIAYSAGGPEALAIEVRWERAITEEGDDHTYVTVFAEDGLKRSYRPFDKAPGWVPRPPASWHAIVSELAAEVLA